MAFARECACVCVWPNPINCLVNVVYWYDNTQHCFYSIIFPFFFYNSFRRLIVCVCVYVCVVLLFSYAASAWYNESFCRLVCFIFEIAHCLFIKLWNKFSRASDFAKYMMTIRDVYERANCLQHRNRRYYAVVLFYFG